MNSITCSQGHQNATGSRFCQHCGEFLAGSTPATPETTAVATTITELQPGTRLRDRYIIVRQLGQGGFGRTYLIEDTGRFHEHLVIKEFIPAIQGTTALQKAEELFQREATILHRLQHPQIPRFWEIFRDQKRLFLVQDYVAGDTYQQILNERLQSGQRFSESEIIQLLRDLLPVLGYLHQHGVIHRDISPDNIIRRQDGLPILIDLGGVKEIAINIATQMAESQNVSKGVSSGGGTCLGKFGYAPDEQMRLGIVAPHSDLYALAVTVLVLLTGKEPQQLLDPNSLTWTWEQEVRLSPKLTKILNQMLATRPGERFQSAEEILPLLPAPVPATEIVNAKTHIPNANQVDVSSSQHIDHPTLPPEILGWNWGAFLLPNFWPLSNRVWLGLLSWIPLVGFVMAFILGAKGNEWAWKSRSWRSVSAFKAHQRAWAIAGFVALGGVTGLTFLILLLASNPASSPDVVSSPSVAPTSPPPSPSVPPEPTAPVNPNSELTVGNYYLASQDAAGNFVPAEDKVFQKGEVVYFILANVGPFEPGADGKSWFDLGMNVTGPNGETVFAQNDLIGERGRLALQNNFAPSPYVYLSKTEELPAGEYTFEASIYDKIGTGRATRTLTFELE